MSKRLNVINETEFRKNLELLSCEKTERASYTTYLFSVNRPVVILEVRLMNQDRSQWFVRDENVTWQEFYDLLTN